MTHGYPDFGVNTQSLSQFDQDNAELAARLGSPYTILRTGHVLWYDTFEVGIGAWNTIIPAGCSIVDSTTLPYAGAHCCEINGGAVANANCAIHKRIPLLKVGVYSLDVLVYPVRVAPNTPDKIQVFMAYYTRTLSYSAQLLLDAVTGRVLYYARVGGVGMWVELTPGDGPLYDVQNKANYNFIHLSLDFQAGLYKLLVINEKAYDMSAAILNFGAGTFTPGLAFQIGVISNGASQLTRFDNVVITMDEL
jgi:hypothetical protein